MLNGEYAHSIDKLLETVKAYEARVHPRVCIYCMQDIDTHTMITVDKGVFHIQNVLNRHYNKSGKLCYGSYYRPPKDKGI